jgi:hypothetical protein
MPAVSILTQFASGFVGSLVLWGSLALSVYFFTNQNTFLGFTFLNVIVTLYCSIQVKMQRRNAMLRAALSNEQIFCFLFYTNTMSLYDKNRSKMIYVGAQSW